MRDVAMWSIDCRTDNFGVNLFIAPPFREVSVRVWGFSEIRVQPVKNAHAPQHEGVALTITSARQLIAGQQQR